VYHYRFVTMVRMLEFEPKSLCWRQGARAKFSSILANFHNSLSFRITYPVSFILPDLKSPPIAERIDFQK
jgi:hypothetical protein